MTTHLSVVVGGAGLGFLGSWALGQYTEELLSQLSALDSAYGQRGSGQRHF